MHMAMWAKNSPNPAMISSVTTTPSRHLICKQLLQGTTLHNEPLPMSTCKELATCLSVIK